jgi:hypothetical protein
MRRCAIAAAAFLLLPGAAGAVVTTVDRHGTTLVNGRKVFPIVLAKGPERGTPTPGTARRQNEGSTPGST